jgi:hypothetical protein
MANLYTILNGKGAKGTGALYFVYLSMQHPLVVENFHAETDGRMHVSRPSGIRRRESGGK